MRPRVLRDAREVPPAPLPRTDAHAPFWWLLLRSAMHMLLPQPGRETWWDALRRARRVWDEVRQQPAPLVAIVAHGRIIRLLLFVAHLLPGMHIQRRRTHKAGVSRVIVWR